MAVPRVSVSLISDLFGTAVITSLRDAMTPWSGRKFSQTIEHPRVAID